MGVHRRESKGHHGQVKGQEQNSKDGRETNKKPKGTGKRKWARNKGPEVVKVFKKDLLMEFVKLPALSLPVEFLAGRHP